MLQWWTWNFQKKILKMWKEKFRKSKTVLLRGILGRKFRRILNFAPIRSHINQNGEKSWKIVQWFLCQKFKICSIVWSRATNNKNLKETHGTGSEIIATRTMGGRPPDDVWQTMNKFRFYALFWHSRAELKITLESRMKVVKQERTLKRCLSQVKKELNEPASVNFVQLGVMVKKK